MANFQLIGIDERAWEAMIGHVRAAYPNEGCGIMLGEQSGGEGFVRAAVGLDNAHPGSLAFRYELRVEDLLSAGREAHAQGLQVVGVFHSHPDRAACFSETDLKNAWPWFCYLVISIRKGEFDGAACWRLGPGRAQIPVSRRVFPQIL